jgi:hypothetical protein
LSFVLFVENKQIGGRRGKLSGTMSERVQWTVFQHAMEAFGISDVVAEQASWSSTRREEFAGAMGQLVATLTLLKDLAGTATQADERTELVNPFLCFVVLLFGSQKRQFLLPFCFFELRVDSFSAVWALAARPRAAVRARGGSERISPNRASGVVGVTVRGSCCSTALL